MKRYRLGDEGELQSISPANILMLLSYNNGEVTGHHHLATGRVFECKTCNRRFPSFQALGSRRVSHKKLRLLGDGSGPAEDGGPRVHACSVCGLEFAIRQALGGHMRCHRSFAVAVWHDVVERKYNSKRVFSLELDLNLPPLVLEDDDIESRDNGFGLKLGMWDFFH